jgi:uncharacterized membrane protein SpoIIM required for sporulation
MAMDNRALAGGILGFVAMIVIAALLYTLFEPAIDQAGTSLLSQTSNQDATDQINLFDTIWSNILWVGLFFAMLFIIGRGVVESRRPG